MMNNAGGAWDNAKKFVETGQLGGSGSQVHKATVVGDTVGDPFKDTAGPCINILIKLMSMVSIVFAGLIVAYSPMIEGIYMPKYDTSHKIELGVQTPEEPFELVPQELPQTEALNPD